MSRRSSRNKGGSAPGGSGERKEAEGEEEEQEFMTQEDVVEYNTIYAGLAGGLKGMSPKHFHDFRTKWVETMTKLKEFNESMGRSYQPKPLAHVLSIQTKRLIAEHYLERKPSEWKAVTDAELREVIFPEGEQAQMKLTGKEKRDRMSQLAATLRWKYNKALG